ncbi:hypothetical protein N9N28_10705 [Rubripirellula amarantea]|nr:hypothetical protein [Rubripirellula amarantea]
MSTPSLQRPSRKWRLILSVLVSVHLAAVILHPLSFQAQGDLGASPVITTLFAPFRGYGQLLYIDRGYAFFAPDPGPSHLIQAAITAKDGSRVEKMYPDLDQHQPRLMYHRHFMLSEYLHEIYQPPGPPRDLVAADPEAAEYWTLARTRYVKVHQSIVNHLNHEHPGQESAIRRIEHLIPDLGSYIDKPIELDDPQLYRVLLDRPIGVRDAGGSVEALTAPDKPAEAIPSPTGEPVR